MEMHGFLSIILEQGLLVMRRPAEADNVLLLSRVLNLS